MSENEEIVVENKLTIAYNYFAGEIVSRFYDEVEENHMLWGIKCPKCGRVYLPPRQTCGPCFENMNEWIKVETEGVVSNFTIVRYSEPGYQPMEPPFVLALIKLGGADTPFVHLLGEIDPDQVKIGMKVRAVFAEEKTGDILNIRYFRPA